MVDSEGDPRDLLFRGEEEDILGWGNNRLGEGLSIKLVERYTRRHGYVSNCHLVGVHKDKMSESELRKLICALGEWRQGRSIFAAWLPSNRVLHTGEPGGGRDRQDARVAAGQRLPLRYPIAREINCAKLKVECRLRLLGLLNLQMTRGGGRPRRKRKLTSLSTPNEIEKYVNYFDTIKIIITTQRFSSIHKKPLVLANRYGKNLR